MNEPSLSHHVAESNNSNIEIPPASAADDEAFAKLLVDIINVEYRWGEAGVVVDGTMRTTFSEVTDQLRARQLIVAFDTSPSGQREAIGCIYIKKLNSTYGNLGLLAVRKKYHGGGIARDLVRFGEEYCRSGLGLDFMQIELLVPTSFESPHKVRLEKWYTKKLGYKLVSNGDFAADYPHMVPVLIGSVDYRTYRKNLKTGPKL
ncbi:hypothetical protein F4808DRAFT_376421 [Astrocystis sublimbata]|nr:hypothetical protein F4808DRAFT_376421 [Astrocystis sublimbata]